MVSRAKRPKSLAWNHSIKEGGLHGRQYLLQQLLLLQQQVSQDFWVHKLSCQPLTNPCKRIPLFFILFLELPPISMSTSRMQKVIYVKRPSQEPHGNAPRSKTVPMYALRLQCVLQQGPKTTGSHEEAQWWKGFCLPFWELPQGVLRKRKLENTYEVAYRRETLFLLVFWLWKVICYPGTPKWSFLEDAHLNWSLSEQ